MIAVLGGTGREGRGLARRWARAGLQVVIGSRDRHRARTVAAELSALTGRVLAGEENLDAARMAEVVVLCVPFPAQAALLAAIAGAVRGKVVLDVAVPLDPGDPTRYRPPGEGSAVAQAQSILGRGTPVVGAFQTVAAHELDSDHPLQADVLVVGADPMACRVAVDLAEQAGARAFVAGGLEQAPAVEALTPLLIGLNKRYRRRGMGIRLSGI